MPALTEWFVKNVPGATAPLTAERISGGKSNLTYGIADGSSTWILRRPPLGNVLATAHDMTREHRVIHALQPTSVPVPRTFGLCEDETVIGAPFYVMSRVDGIPYRTADELRRLGPQRTRAISENLVDTLVTLHAVDPDAVGLADFGRPEGFVQRQVRRWHTQMQSAHHRELAGSDELHALLVDRVPEHSDTAIVHGDYRLDNLLTDAATDQVNAVLDWEMATLGDPLTDLALMVLYQRLAAIEGIGASDVSTAPGHLTESEMIERYAHASGRDLDGFGFYVALAAYKLAAILEGIHLRHLNGRTVGEGFETIGNGVEPLLDLGLTAIRKD
ncbi:MAG: phosphotransferase family protein [Actinobacteria bacterium]|nr:phosphotransferase family protein [Actinomycetota bacterium]